MKPFSLWTLFYFSMIMLGVGCGPQVGPFLSRPTMGSIRGCEKDNFDINTNLELPLVCMSHYTFSKTNLCV